MQAWNSTTDTIVTRLLCWDDKNQQSTKMRQDLSKFCQFIISRISFLIVAVMPEGENMGGGNLPSLVGIGLTDLPNIGGALWPPWHPRFRQYCVVLTSWFSLRTIFYCSFHVPFALFFTHNFCYFRIISEIRLIWNIEIWNKLMLWLHLKKIFSNLQKKRW